MVSPYAAFDSLYIAAALKNNVPYPVAAEIYVLAYLAALLSLYRGQPVADWGYGFAGTRRGLRLAPRLARQFGHLPVPDSCDRVNAGSKSLKAE